MLFGDIHKSRLALLVLAAMAIGRSADAGAALPTPSGTQIPTSVSLAYQPWQNAPMRTVTSNTAIVTVRQPAMTMQTTGAVPQATDVVLTPPLSSQRILRPTRTFFPITIRNTGGATDTFSLGLTQPAGWAGTLLPLPGSNVAPTQVTLAPGQSRTLLLVVTPPTVLPKGASGMIVLRAVSGADTTQYAQAAIVTSAGLGVMGRR